MKEIPIIHIVKVNQDNEKDFEKIYIDTDSEEVML